VDARVSTPCIGFRGRLLHQGNVVAGMRMKKGAERTRSWPSFAPFRTALEAISMIQSGDITNKVGYFFSECL